jgi:hypothetical protein
MSTDQMTGRQKATMLVVTVTTLAVVIVVGLLLREHGPGNMGNGFLQGAGVGLVLASVALWRALRRPESATTFERAFTQTGDERDDSVLTRALAVLGILAVPLTGAATVAIGLGAQVEMVLALLLFAEIGVGAVAFWLINRRS